MTLTYDSGCLAGIGRLCAKQDQSGTTTYAYGVHGNRLQQVHTDLGIAYTTGPGSGARLDIFSPRD